MRYGSFLRSRKFRYGSLSVSLTALVIALIVLLNTGISALARRYGLYTDMTSEKLYTLTDECRDLLEQSFVTTAAERVEFNKNLPSYNLSVAEVNVDRIADTLANAEKNIELSTKNTALVNRNLELFSKSIALTEDNLDIASKNLTLARDLYEFVKDKEGEAADNTAAAAALVALAEENLAIAEENIETAAANRAASSGFTPLKGYNALSPLEGYKYYGVFTAQINDDDSITAAENARIAEENRVIAEENKNIAAANLESAKKNRDAGAYPGSAGYIAMSEYLEYTSFVEFTTYKKINGSETPRVYEPYLETGVESALVEDMKVRIIFCDERDALYENTTQRYVLETAEDMARAFPDIITVEFINVWTNPSAVQKYKGTSLTNIYSTNIILESGSEWRTYALNAFFVFSDSTSTTPWSYNGEKKFASGILSVIKAELPIACFTLNHGETFTDYALLTLVQDAGYNIEFINLANQEIPEDCRLIVVNNPASDFLVRSSTSDISEIAKLNSWLDEFNALMVFMSPSSPVLPNLEEYLEEWGVVFNRVYNDENGEVFPYMIKDPGQSLTADGMTIVAEYTTKGLGASIHTDMRSVTYPPKVIFKNSMSISYPSTYDETTFEDENDPNNNYRYASYYSNGVTRSIYDIFVSSPNAVALAGGEQVAAASTLEPFKLMTITRETQMVSNEDADYSYVLASASTAFTSQDLLQSNVYGNSDVLISALRSMSRETIVVDLKHKPFASTTIDSITTAEANQYTVILTIVPAAIVLGIGIYVTVRRKYS